MRVASLSLSLSSGASLSLPATAWSLLARAFAIGSISLKEPVLVIGSRWHVLEVRARPADLAQAA